MQRSINSISSELHAVSTGDYFVHLDTLGQQLSFIEEHKAED